MQRTAVQFRARSCVIINLIICTKRGIHLALPHIFKNSEGKNCSDIWCVHLYIAKINDLGETKTKVLIEKLNCLQSANLYVEKFLIYLSFYLDFFQEDFKLNAAPKV